MLVEVFGPSCAGKSTVIADLIDGLRADGIAAEDVDGERDGPRMLRARDVVRGLTAPEILVWCLLNPSRAWSDHGRIFLRGAGSSKRLRALSRSTDTGKIIVVDEGPLKRLSTLAENSRGPALLLRGTPAPDVAVLVTCDFDERLRRLRATGRSAAKSMSDTELRARDLAKARWNDRIVDRLPVDVIRLDTSSGRGASVEAMQEVRARLDRSTGGKL